MAFGQCDAGEPAGEHPHVGAVVDRKRAKVGVAGPEAVVGQGGDGGELDHRLSNPAAGVPLEGRAQIAQLAGGGVGPHEDSFPSGAIDRLDHQFVEPIQDLGQSLGFLKPPGIHVRQNGLFAEVVADEVGDVGVDQLVVGHPVAHAVGDGDVAEPGREHQPRSAQDRIGAELLRVQELIVNAPINHVDAGRTRGGVHEHVPARTEQIAPLHQFHAHHAREQRVLIVGGVEYTRGENHDGRIGDARRRGRPQRLQEPRRVVAHRPHPHAREKFRKRLGHHLPVG